MTIIEKTELIQRLGTAQLVRDIVQQEAEILQLQSEELNFRAKNSDFIPGKASSDCDAVKKLEAELIIQAPVDPESKKSMTVDAKKAWLERQHTENKAMADLIQKQKMAEFTSGDLNIRLEAAQRKLTDLRGVLALRTAQITFFAGDVRTTLALEDEITEQT
jgi:hypothetical protein